MTHASRAAIVALKTNLLQVPSKPATCGDIADAIDLIINLFDQGDAQLFTLGSCVDDLAAHTAYQLKKETANPEG